MVEPFDIPKSDISDAEFEKAFLLKAFLKTLDPIGGRDSPFLISFF
jgi:hypothetical protein